MSDITSSANLDAFFASPVAKAIGTRAKKVLDNGSLTNAATVADPSAFNLTSSQPYTPPHKVLPPWALPVGIGAAVLLVVIIAKKKGRK